MDLNDFVDFSFTSPRPHPVGRPPKLTPEMIEEICDHIISGYSIAAAGNKVKVSESTIYRWLALGRATGSEQIYVDLAERVREATECSEFELLQGMRMSAKKSENWRALAWLLERRFPQKYGKTQGMAESSARSKADPGEPTVLAAV